MKSKHLTARAQNEVIWSRTIVARVQENPFRAVENFARKLEGVDF